MSELAELMEAMMEFHNKASKTLEKMISDVQTSRTYAEKVCKSTQYPMKANSIYLTEKRTVKETWRRCAGA